MMFEDKQRVVKVLRWTARILSLLPIWFVLMEVLFPHSDPEIPVRPEEWIAVGVMFSSVIGLALAWRWEKLGGWISVGALALFPIVFRIVYGEFYPLMGMPPLLAVLIPAVLFLWCGYQSAKNIE